ncbi:MAG: hypothetical protein RR233_09315, partial [Clostridiales bacterium]
MGFFKKSPSLESNGLSASKNKDAQRCLKQLQEAIDLTNSTNKADIFFGRLNYSLDICLYMQEFEKYGIYQSPTPSETYKEIIANIETNVDNFLKRSLAKELESLSNVKSENARVKKLVKYFVDVDMAFEKSNKCWGGNGLFPRYEGALFTDNNLQTLK